MGELTRVVMGDGSSYWLPSDAAPGIAMARADNTIMAVMTGHGWQAVPNHFEGLALIDRERRLPAARVADDITAIVKESRDQAKAAQRARADLMTAEERAVIASGDEAAIVAYLDNKIQAEVARLLSLAGPAEPPATGILSEVRVRSDWRLRPEAVAALSGPIDPPATAPRASDAAVGRAIDRMHACTPMGLRMGP